ncbi:MAG TPA: (d)CMP kinase [Gemmatimonadaceae bacterium]|nr:(d)CMP kinase [Gemmatimonadaceae bacterium]
MIIAIDGPAAAGKSTTARLVAAALGFRYIDSGSLYRAAAAARARRGGAAESWTEQEVIDAVAIVTLVPVDGAFEPWLDGSRVDEELRSAEVTASVPYVAQMPGVRSWVNYHVRAAADMHDAVVDGRDMGTAVFPRAALKIYLVADSWQRARRRLVQRSGTEPTDDEVAAEMVALRERDTLDEAQSVMASDAVIVDTSDITQQEQVAHIVALARALRGTDAR